MQPEAESLVGWKAKSVFDRGDFKNFLFTAETPIFLLVATEKR